MVIHRRSRSSQFRVVGHAWPCCKKKGQVDGFNDLKELPEIFSQLLG